MPSRRLRIASFAAALPAAYGVGRALARTGTTVDRTVSTLHIPAAALDAGEVYASATQVFTVPVANTGGEPVAVRLAASCNCTGVTPAVFTLEPHAGRCF